MPNRPLERLTVEDIVRGAGMNLGLEVHLDSPFKDDWDFLERAIFTKDESAGQVRPFPAERNYLMYMTRTRMDHRIYAIDKSRRMLVTWWLLSLYLYDTLTKPNHANFIGSRKLETSAYLLGEERTLFLYEHIPHSVWPNKPHLIPMERHMNGYALLKCPETGSYMQAIASGADQLRQFTATNIFCDEAAFWERWSESWQAMVPTILGGGHIDIVTTPQLGAEVYSVYYDAPDAGISSDIIEYGEDSDG